jgi:hypothetical protein
MKFLREKPWEVSSNNSVIATAHNELPTQNQPVEENNLNRTFSAQTQAKTNNFLFKKDVDLKLLKYGFTIPQSAIRAFCSNIRVVVPYGGSYRISLVVKGITYPVTLSNDGFPSETKQQMEVRYSQTSPIANALRSIFTASNERFIAGKQADNIEYIEVVCISTDKFELICHPLKLASTVKPEDDIVAYTAESDMKTGDYIRDTIWQYNNTDRRKYARLKQWLIDNDNESVIVPFSNIANLVGGLPPSAYQYRAFWSNTNSHPFSVAWMEAGYKVVDCDLQSQHVRFIKVGKENRYIQSASRMTIKAAMIEYSNINVGKIKTRKEICDELSAKYGFPNNDIHPEDFEISLSNSLPKLFRRIDHSLYECLGYCVGSKDKCRD